MTLVWNKPEKYDTVADYAIYQDGELIGTARENFAEHADWASTYMDAFYEYYEKKNIEMVNVDYKNIPIHEGDNVVCMGKVIGKVMY